MAEVKITTDDTEKLITLSDGSLYLFFILNLESRSGSYGGCMGLYQSPTNKCIYILSSLASSSGNIEYVDVTTSAENITIGYRSGGTYYTCIAGSFSNSIFKSSVALYSTGVQSFLFSYVVLK